MLTIEKYGAMYLAMTTAFSNPELQQQICQEHGVSLADWTEANAHFMAKMSSSSDMGQTAMALAKYMMPAAPAQPVLNLPDNFTTDQIEIFVNELTVQMVLFRNADKYVELQCSVNVDPGDEFLTNYVKGRVHLSINEQDYSIYGGVTQVQLSRDGITFKFDEEGKDRMKRDQVHLAFNISNKKYQYLVRTLTYMYKEHPVLTIANENIPAAETWDGITYDLGWDSFQLNENMKVNLRPNIGNLRESGKYGQVITISFMHANAEAGLFESFKQELETTFESDYSTVIALITNTAVQSQMSLYSSLPQDKFMQRLNEALCYLPKLPIEINGGADPSWQNYQACHKDYLAAKSS